MEPSASSFTAKFTETAVACSSQDTKICANICADAEDAAPIRECDIAENAQNARVIYAWTRMTPCLAHAYHFWGRKANENVNGLTRDLFPKKTDFRQISDQELKAVEDNLNNRPRRRLGRLTPLEILLEVLAKELEKLSIASNPLKTFKNTGCCTCLHLHVEFTEWSLDI